MNENKRGSRELPPANLSPKYGQTGIREIKIHVYAKRQTWICTTWPSFPLIFRLPFIASTQKYVVLW